MIPFADPRLRFEEKHRELHEALDRVTAGGAFILGEEVARFEHRFSAMAGHTQGVGVGNGTDAITIALLALGIGPGDEVILPSLTAHGSALGVAATGATPTFADVDPSTRMLSPDKIRASITDRTAAILVVHLYGWMAPVSAIRQLADAHGLALLEDCAQATGASHCGEPAGSFGDVSTFSFYPTKNLGCPGDGGMVVTSDPAVAVRARAIRSFGWSGPERVSETPARNSRLDELHAAFLSVLAEDLPEQVERRRATAAAYRHALAGLPVGLPQVDDGAAPHLFVVTTPDRESLRSHLSDAGLGTGVHYPIPLHRQPAFRSPVPLPVTDRLCATVVSLPVQPELSSRFDLAGRYSRELATWTA